MIALAIVITIGCIALAGLISMENNTNTWENLYKNYVEGRNETLNLKLQMMEEERRMKEEDTKQISLSLNAPDL